VSQDLAGSPLGELYLGFDFGAQPNVVGHFVGDDAFTPAGLAAGHRREVGEGAFVGGEGLEEFEEGAAVGGVEALVDFGGE
jgi:hypothetical protein